MENSLIYSLTQISLVHRNHLQKAMSSIGLNSGQVFVLFSLWKNDGQSQIELVNNLAVTAPTVNKMVAGLSRTNFVECRKCTSDGRVMRVFLTEKGLECKSAVEEKWAELETNCFSNLTETEKLILLQILDKLRENNSRFIALQSNDL